MELDELKQACLAALADGRDGITLVLPRGVRLCGRYGPVGELLCDAGRGSVVRFKVASVLRFVERVEDSERPGAVSG